MNLVVPWGELVVLIAPHAPAPGAKGRRGARQGRKQHPFRVIKRQLGHVKVRYRGLAKNTAQWHTLFALSNLWMARGFLDWS